MEKNARAKRISQGTNKAEANIHGLYEGASSVARRVLESMQALAGTTSCKGVQISELEKWAKANGCWIENSESLGIYADRGSENEVYVSHDGTELIKYNDFRYSDDNLEPFFERYEAQNYYFPYCGYNFIGMGRNRDGKVCAVMTQPFIVAEREATEEEISNEMNRMGFRTEYEGECYTNGCHDIYDALPNNVLLGVDGRLYFIDTIIYKSSKDNISIYRKQSPRF